MLILTRKANEGILVGDDIKITVVSIEGGRVKLGITAPRNISVIREEVVDAVKKENMSAGKTDTLNVDDLSAIASLIGKKGGETK